MIRDFEGRTAVVTGAGSGIGRALAVRCSEAGMNVVCADVESAALDETVGSVGGSAIGVLCDVSSADSVAALADAAFGAFDEVHLLCNNAGVFQAGLVWEATPADWEWALGVNVWGIIHGIRSFVPRMIAQGGEGHVVNTASLAAFMTGSFTSPYTVTKQAALSLTESLAEGLRAVGSSIGASVLAPSAVNTRIAESRRNRPGGAEEAETAVAVNEGLAAILQDGIAPAEVAELVLEAVRTDQFVIPTSSAFDDQVESRMTAWLRRELPPMLDSY